MTEERGLSRRWLLITAVVFLADLFFHLPITDFCDWLARRYGFAEYDYAVRIGFIAVGVLSLAAVWLWASRDRVTFGVAITGLLALTVIAHKLIVVNAVESIHYPQYALLVGLLARAGAGLEPAWLVATGLGAIDEGYQALALPRGAPDYFDWNDVVLNGIGATFGVVIVLAFMRASAMRAARPLRIATWLFAAALLVAIVVSPPVWSPFFQVTPGGRHFHRLSASEGIGVLMLLYLAVSRLARKGPYFPAK